MTTGKTLDRAQALASGLPRLILAAERLAFIAAPGLHGRRRSGPGDSFWQFRDWQTGDDVRHVDWRRSARGDRLYLKEREWEAQASIVLALEDMPTLDFQSQASLPTKRDRIILLLMALAAILLRAGERVALAGITPPLTGSRALETLALALATGGSAPADPNARRVTFGDFLRSDLAFSPPAGGAVMHVLDPAECDFPYAGRIIFQGLAGEHALEAAHAQDWKPHYLARIAAQRDAVRQAATAARLTPLFHRTDRPPAQALAALYQALLRK